MSRNENFQMILGPVYYQLKPKINIILSIAIHEE